VTMQKQRTTNAGMKRAIPCMLNVAHVGCGYHQPQRQGPQTSSASPAGANYRQSPDQGPLANWPETSRLRGFSAKLMSKSDD
jgi:hypothetical protein